MQTKKYNAIMAVDYMGGIAKNGTLPWPKNKTDFQHFKRITENNVVVMGSGTWNDPAFPKPLPNRTNVVLSSKTISGPHFVFNNDEYEERLKEFDKPVFFIGGAKVIADNLHLIDTMYLTIFKNNYHCDKFIPIGEFLTWETIDHKMEDDLVFITLRRKDSGD